MAPVPVKAVPKAVPVKKAPVAGGRFTYDSGVEWDTQGADWAVGGGLFGTIGDVVWAREAEVKHGRICMLAATGAIVQDLYTFPFMSKWYQGEKMWGLHDAAIKSGAMWQVLFFVGLLEIPFMLNLANDSVDGTGDLGFDPLGCGKDPNALARRRIAEVKNGRLAMIAMGGVVHQQLLTKQGTLEQLASFKAIAN